MALIFHRFPNAAAALAFSEHVARTYDRRSEGFTTDAASFAADPFPFELTPPIVHVERIDDDELEPELEASVSAFGGAFAGT